MRPTTPTPRPYYNVEAEFDLINEQTLTAAVRKGLVTDPAFTRLNRYTDVLPFAHNIVALDDSALLRPENYINASLISHPLEQSSVEFIASQAPMNHTMEAFCRMVLRHKVTEIISIINAKESTTRYFDYWTQGGTYGGYKVVTVGNKEKKGICRAGSLKVVKEGASEEWKVRHVHIDAWEDYSALPKEDIGSLLDILQELASRSSVIVHCSAGVGRTFSFICSYYLFEQHSRICANPNAKKHSIKDLVCGLRRQRYGAINTVKQYEFLHEFLRFLEEKGESSASELRKLSVSLDISELFVKLAT